MNRASIGSEELAERIVVIQQDVQAMLHYLKRVLYNAKKGQAQKVHELSNELGKCIQHFQSHSAVGQLAIFGARRFTTVNAFARTAPSAHLMCVVVATSTCEYLVTKVQDEMGIACEVLRNELRRGKWGVFKRDAERVSIELAFEAQQAVVLIKENFELAHELMGYPAAPPDSLPKWNRSTGELKYESRLCRKINVGKARNIVKVLDAFEELGWVSEIFDPLPNGKNPKRLNETIESLNTNLEQIRFRATGTGDRFSWHRLD